MRNRIVAFVAVGVVGIVALWWVFVFSPLGRDLDDARGEREQAERQESSLNAQLRQLQEIDRNAPETDAELARLAEAIPENPDLADFFVAANEIAVQSGIDWISVSPAEPAPVPGSPSTVRVNVQLTGGFFQILDYLNRLEDLDRLFIVDTISVASAATQNDTTSGTSGSGGSFGGGFDGAPSLTSTLTGRMFTQATTVGSPATTTTTSPSGPATTGSASTTEVAN